VSALVLVRTVGADRERRSLFRRAGWQAGRVPFDHAITDDEGLRRVYRQPHALVQRKVIDRVDHGARRFIAASPFVVVSTAGPDGVDASPRGGPPGFVTVLDDHRLALGDLAGNNRLDSFRNIVASAQVGLLFLIPGVGETLRVNGRATLTDDPAVLDACPVGGTRPRVALGVDVDECYVHCAKAFRRSGLWDPASWADPTDRPSAAAIIKAHVRLDDVPTEAIENDLEAGYAATMWQPGGQADPADPAERAESTAAAEAG
jgi:hypothetical protein